MYKMLLDYKFFKKQIFRYFLEIFTLANIFFLFACTLSNPKSEIIYSLSSLMFIKDEDCFFPFSLWTFMTFSSLLLIISLFIIGNVNLSYVLRPLQKYFWREYK
jgi:hypothetical protein